MNTKAIKDIKDICDVYGAEFLIKTPTAPYTSFKIGGDCNIVRVNGTEVLRSVLTHCKSQCIPCRILGKGSNVLISDNGLNGIILLFNSDGFGRIDVDGTVIKCQAGAKLSDICRVAVLHSLTGMEFAYGIPGTAGGALCMNAGAYGGEMADVVESCSYFSPTADCFCSLCAEDMKLSYRHSIFSENSDFVVARVKLHLKYGDRNQIKTRMDEITAARREKQPLEFPSAGSTFKRPKPDGSGGAVYAAKLIQDCGLRGYTIGGAQVSEKHAGFVINKGGATFCDVVNLMDFIKEEVFNKTGVILEPEVRVWKD